MSDRVRTPLLAAAVLVVGALTACAPAVGGQASSTSQTATPDGAPSSTASPTATPAADVSPNGILGIALGEPFDDAVARAGATPAEGCERIATVDGAEYSLEIQRPDPPLEPVSPVEVVAVAAPVGNAAQGPVGPTTAEGIGIGSSLDEARAAYPDAATIPTPDGPQHFLKVAVGDDGAALFLAYTEGTPVIWGMTATTLQAPPYEPCS